MTLLPWTDIDDIWLIEVGPIGLSYGLDGTAARSVTRVAKHFQHLKEASVESEGNTSELNN
jgi:hypothetical protein